MTRIWLNCYILLYFNSFVAIKILLHYDCFDRDSGSLHATPFTAGPTYCSAIDTLVTTSASLVDLKCGRFSYSKLST